MISVLQWTEFPRRSGGQTSRRLFVLIVIGHTLLVISAEAFIGVPLLRRHCTAMTAKSSPSERRVCLQPEPFCFIWLLKRRNEAVSFGEHMGLDTSLIIHKASVSCVPVDCCVATSVFFGLHLSVHSTAAMAHASEIDADMDRAREPVTDSGDAHAGVNAGEHTSSSSTRD